MRPQASNCKQSLIYPWFLEASGSFPIASVPHWSFGGRWLVVADVRALLVFKDHPLLMIHASEHSNNKSYAVLVCTIKPLCYFEQIWIFQWMKSCANTALCKSWKMEDAQTKLLHLKDCCHQPAFSSFLEYPQKVKIWKISVCVGFSNMICSSQKNREVIFRCITCLLAQLNEFLKFMAARDQPLQPNSYCKYTKGLYHSCNTR